MLRFLNLCSWWLVGGASVSELVRLGGLWAVHRFLNLCSFSARFCGQCLGGLWGVLQCSDHQLISVEGSIASPDSNRLWSISLNGFITACYILL